MFHGVSSFRRLQTAFLRVSQPGAYASFPILHQPCDTTLTNADHYSHFETIVYYREPWRQYAQELARLLPAVVELEIDDSQRADVRIELGGDLLDFDRRMYYVIKRSDAHAG